MRSRQALDVEPGALRGLASPGRSAAWRARRVEGTSQALRKRPYPGRLSPKIV